MRLIPIPLLLSCFLAAAPAAPAVAQPAQPALSRDQRAWVDSTLAGLSLREKVGQLVVGWTGGEYVATDSPEMDYLLGMVERDGIGGW